MEGMTYETKVTTKLHLNFKDVDKHYDGDGRLRFCPENISSMLTGSHFLELQVRDYPNEEKYVIFTSFGVKNLKSEVDLEILLADSSKIKIVESSNAAADFQAAEEDLQGFLLCLHHIRMRKESRIQTITGIVMLTFEPAEGIALKDQLIYKYGQSVFEPRQETEPGNSDDDIKIECQGEMIHFHKSLLSKISDVFQKMVENPNLFKIRRICRRSTNFVESQIGVITMKDISLKTIKAFKKLLYNKQIEGTDLDAKLMIFCHSYNIKLMVDLCSQHLQKLITKENLMEIVDAAYKINDDDLLKKAMDFVNLNYRSFEEIEQWKDFLKSNPRCVAKMMEFMMFK